MVEPNFLIIGGQKCGTTWLHEIVGQHPDAFISIPKEPHFFDKTYNYGKGITWYQNCFSDWDREKAIGEATPNYFYVSSDANEIAAYQLNWNIPELIHKHYPGMKLIVSLRDPVQRAISAYYHFIRKGRLSPKSHILDVKNEYSIVGKGFYYDHFCQWLKFFSLDQFLILVYEDDIVKNKEKTIRRIYRFLEIDEDFKPNNLEMRYNSRLSSLQLYILHYAPTLAKKAAKILPALKKIRFDYPKIKVFPEEVCELTRLYIEPSQRLEALLGRDLPWSHRSRSI